MSVKQFLASIQRGQGHISSTGATHHGTIESTLQPDLSLPVHDPAAHILDLSPITAAGDMHYGLTRSDSVRSESMSLTPVLSPPHLAATHAAGDVTTGSDVGSSSFPLRFSIEPKHLERIKQGLFVPFDILLISKQGGSVDHYLKNLSPSIDSQMEVATIMSIEKWTDAFLIFMAIWISVHLQDASALLQYVHSIPSVFCNTPGPLWFHYDREFRMRRQFNHQLPWDSVHPQLYFQLLSCFASSLRPDVIAHQRMGDGASTPGASASPAEARSLIH